MARREAVGTKVELTDFKGSPLIQLWEVDDKNVEVSQYPLISMGKKKAQEIVKHIEEIKKFAQS